jgi:hypothetical protein
MKHDMTLVDPTVCTRGCRVAETSNHLFFECDSSQSLWSKIVSRRMLLMHTHCKFVIRFYLVRMCDPTFRLFR